MSYCGSATIAIRDGKTARAFPLRCRAWTCPHCAPRRRAKLIREAKEGLPTRFVTLTCNPAWFDSPEDRGARLVRAWRDYVRQYRKRYKNRSLEYLAVLELTKRGEPHIHLVVRGDRIDQKELSAFMADAMGAPVVDVRLVREQGEVARYVTKYISKRPIKLGTLKRYWRSANYLDREKIKAARAAKAGRAVWIIDQPIDEFRALLLRNGRVVWAAWEGDLQWLMYPFEPRPPGVSEQSRRVH